MGRVVHGRRLTARSTQVEASGEKKDGPGEDDRGAAHAAATARGRVRDTAIDGRHDAQGRRSRVSTLRRAHGHLLYGGWPVDEHLGILRCGDERARTCRAHEEIHHGHADSRIEPSARDRVDRGRRRYGERKLALFRAGDTARSRRQPRGGLDHGALRLRVPPR